MITLTDVYSEIFAPAATAFLYDLLAERKVSDSISHKRHPTFAEHDAFVRSKPYLGWFIICDDGAWLGGCYITKYREVGIWLLPEAQGRGAGAAAMKLLLAKYPGRVFTNTSIHNPGAFAFYEKCGFRHCANMLECDNVPSGGDNPGADGVKPAAGQGIDADRRDAGAGVDVKGSEGRRDC